MKRGAVQSCIFYKGRTNYYSKKYEEFKNIVQAKGQENCVRLIKLFLFQPLFFKLHQCWQRALETEKVNLKVPCKPSALLCSTDLSLVFELWPHRHLQAEQPASAPIRQQDGRRRSPRGAARLRRPVQTGAPADIRGPGAAAADEDPGVGEQDEGAGVGAGAGEGEEESSPAEGESLQDEEGLLQGQTKENGRRCTAVFLQQQQRRSGESICPDWLRSWNPSVFRSLCAVLVLFYTFLHHCWQ